ncbi:MAG: hypothetical protein WBN75_08630 [Verrucomicrobiia bacterium]
MGAQWTFLRATENREPITGIKKTRRVPLNDKDGRPVQSVAQAVAELKRLQTQRADNDLPVMGRTPKLSDYVAHYLAFISSGHPSFRLKLFWQEMVN